MLILIYQQMPSDEIQQRLASGELIALAASVARKELKRRQARGQQGQPRKLSLREKIALANQDQHFADMPMSMLVQIGIALLGMAFTLFQPHFDLLLLAWMWGIVMLTRVLGKSFPSLGKPAGWLLLSAPLYMLQFALYEIWKGDYSVAQAVFMLVIYLAVSGIPCYMGYHLLKGARHRGSWIQLQKELAEERAGQAKRVL